MDTLENVLHEELAKIPHELLLGALRGKLDAHGIKLSRRKIDDLARKILEGSVDNIEIEAGGKGANKRITIDFTEDDIKDLDEQFDRIVDDLPNLIQRLAADASEQILITLKRGWRREWATQRRVTGAFRQSLEVQWSSGLQPLRMLITIAREYGSNINAARRKHDRLSTAFDITMRLHARACQVADEIVCLLSNGFADGAMARWRTLHEIAAVARLIDLHGEELAERYEQHHIVDSRKGSQQFQHYHRRLNQEPIERATFEAIEVEYQSAITRYGAEFAKPQGWAAKHLKKSNPSMADIQEAAGIDYLAPYYRMASHNVHANPKGVFFRLGLPVGLSGLLAGPSNTGLADPGHATALSMVFISTLLLKFFPTIDNTIQVRIMHALETEAGAALLAAHKKQEDTW